MKNLYKMAVDKWGAEVQIKMAIEEMAELMVALNHHDRGRATIQEVAGEVADVKIMMKQLEYIIDEKYGDKLVKEKENYKKERLKAMLGFGEWVNDCSRNR